MNQHRLFVAALVAIAIVAALALALQAGSPATGDNAAQATVVAASSKGVFVSGQGEVTVKPDVAYVELGVETQRKTALEAQRENAKISERVVDRLVSLGLSRDKIETTRLSLYPIRNRNKSDEDIVTGYRATNQVRVTISALDRVGQIIDGAVDAGANTVNDIVFSVKDLSKFKAEALKEAARDARERAEAIASALGLKVAGVISISDEGVPVIMTSRPYELRGAGEWDQAKALTPVEPGDVRIHVSLKANFSLK